MSLVARVYSTPIMIIIIITLMGLMAQFASDSFTPSLPYIAKHFGANATWIKAMVGIYFLGMGASAILFGYLSDRYGRKRVLIGGYLLFCASSLLCVLADTEVLLIVFRCLQGIAMGCSLVTFRALMKDYFKGGASLTRATFIISSVVSFTPPLAPITGGYIQECLGWRYNFLLHIILALMILILIWCFLNIKRETSNHGFTASYKLILTNANFILNSICSGLALATVFIFITQAPFLLQNVMGLSPSQYSLALACTILPPAILLISCRNFMQRLDMDYAMIVCALVSIIGCALMSLSYLTFGISFIGVLVTASIIFMGNCFQFSASYICAYRSINSHAGVASAFYGAMQVSVTAIMSLGASIFHLPSQFMLGLLMMLPPILLIVTKLYNIRYHKANYSN